MSSKKDQPGGNSDLDESHDTVDVSDVAVSVGGEDGGSESNQSGGFRKALAWVVVLAAGAVLVDNYILPESFRENQPRVSFVDSFDDASRSKLNTRTDRDRWALIPADSWSVKDGVAQFNPPLGAANAPESFSVAVVPQDEDVQRLEATLVIPRPGTGIVWRFRDLENHISASINETGNGIVVKAQSQDETKTLVDTEVPLGTGSIALRVELGEDLDLLYVNGILRAEIKHNRTGESANDAGIYVASPSAAGAAWDNVVIASDPLEAAGSLSDFASAEADLRLPASEGVFQTDGPDFASLSPAELASLASLSQDEIDAMENLTPQEVEELRELGG